jgi:hypothetical protein
MMLRRRGALSGTQSGFDRNPVTAPDMKKPGRKEGLPLNQANKLFPMSKSQLPEIRTPRRRPGQTVGRLRAQGLAHYYIAQTQPDIVSLFEVYGRTSQSA